MSTWSKDELSKIAEAYDLHVSPFREDGMEYEGDRSVDVR